MKKWFWPRSVLTQIFKQILFFEPTNGLNGVSRHLLESEQTNCFIGAKPTFFDVCTMSLTYWFYTEIFWCLNHISDLIMPKRHSLTSETSLITEPLLQCSTKIFTFINTDKKRRYLGLSPTIQTDYKVTTSDLNQNSWHISSQTFQIVCAIKAVLLDEKHGSFRAPIKKCAGNHVLLKNTKKSTLTAG